MNLKLFLPFIALFLISYCSSENADNKDKEKFLIALAINQTSSPARTCNDPSPTFSSLSSAGFDSSCGRSTCHNGTTKYDTTVYTQVKGYTTPGSPSRSSLFTEQSSGGMKQYTNSTLDDAIYCWIKGGSNP